METESEKHPIGCFLLLLNVSHPQILFCSYQIVQKKEHHSGVLFFGAEKRKIVAKQQSFVAR